MKYLSLSLKLTLATVLLASCSANISNKLIKDAMLKKSEQLLEKKIESSIPLNPSSINTDSLLTNPSSSGTSGLTPMKLLNGG